MTPKWRPRRIEIFVVSSLIVGLWVVLVLAFAHNRAIKRAAYCQTNLKQIGLAMMQYMRDYDELHPLKVRWSESLFPYCKSEKLFHCPSVMQYGYAMNANLSGLNMSLVNEPKATPLVFESAALKKFQADAGTSWLQEPRHKLGRHVLFEDGHVAAVRNKPKFLPFPKRKPKL